MRYFVSRRGLVHLPSLAFVVIALAVSSIAYAEANPVELRQAQPTLTIDPSSLVIKVGQNATARITLSGSQVADGMVCFSMEGFPTSGFIISLYPECVSSGASEAIDSTLTVEATPAAAPQSFNASVVASGANWSVTAPIGITVTPAMPAWIPWSIILVFILVLATPSLVNRMRSRRRRN